MKDDSGSIQAKRSTMKIDTLIFDQGGVLVWTRWEKVTQAWAKLRGTTPQEVMNRMNEGGSYNPFMRGEICREEFKKRMCAHLDIRQSVDEFNELWMSVIEPKHDLTLLLERFVDRYSLIIGSNTDELHQTRIFEVQPIITTFDHLLLSYELGVLKPDKSFFKIGLSKIDISPEQCFFIDDRDDNVEAAASIGIRGIKYETPAQLIAKLGEMDLL